MKQSKFNVFIPLENYTKLIFNTFTDSKVVVDPEGEIAVKKCHQPQLLNEKQRNMLSQLEELGFIVGDDTNEDKYLEYWFQKLKFDATSLEIIILPTFACNMKCIYCFEHEIIQNISMDIDMCMNVCKWLSIKMEDVRPKEFNLTFFGGEPLLNQDAVKCISKYLFDQCRLRDITLKIKIITNGLLLNEELVDYLLPLGLKGVKVTLDGDEKTHDRMRPRKNGTGTYRDIISNILKIKDKVPVAIGGNYDDSSKNSIPKLLDNLKQIGFNGELHKIAFKPILKYPEQGKYPLHISEVCAFSDTNVEDILWLVEETEKKGFSPYKKVALGPCEAIRENTYTIDPKGYIYKCPALAGREECAVGDIASERLTTKNVQFMTSDVWRKCKDCKFVPLCNGGCRASAIIKDNDIGAISCEQEYFEKVSKQLVISELGN